MSLHIIALADIPLPDVRDQGSKVCSSIEKSIGKTTGKAFLTFHSTVTTADMGKAQMATEEAVGPRREEPCPSDVAGAAGEGGEEPLTRLVQLPLRKGFFLSPETARKQASFQSNMPNTLLAGLGLPQAMAEAWFHLAGHPTGSSCVGQDHIKWDRGNNARPDTFKISFMRKAKVSSLKRCT